MDKTKISLKKRYTDKLDFIIFLNKLCSFFTKVVYDKQTNKQTNKTNIYFIDTNI